MPQSQPGNKAAEKWPNREIRKKVFKQLCKHLEGGNSIYCFPGGSEEAIIHALHAHPEDFIREVFDAAQRKGRLHWEKMGNKGTNGKTPGFNAQSWNMNMKNRYGWKDRVEHSGDKDAPVTVNLINYTPPKSQEQPQDAGNRDTV